MLYKLTNNSTSFGFNGLVMDFEMKNWVIALRSGIDTDRAKSVTFSFNTSISSIVI